MTPAARRLEATGSLRDLVQAAFNLHDYQVVGGEGWTSSEIFDVVIQSDRPTSHFEMLELLKTVVLDRFRVDVKIDRSLRGVYVAVPDRGGIKMSKSTEIVSGESSGRNFIRGHLTVAELCRRLPQIVGRPVFDETRTTDRYVVNLSWTDEFESGDASIFTAMKEQLGLQLRATKRLTQQVKIVRAQHPSSN